MKPDDAADRLRALHTEAAHLPTSTSSAEFNSWNLRVRSVLNRALGETHHITETFLDIRWTPTMYTMGDNSAFINTFRATIPEAQGVLDAAIAELDLLADDTPIADESGVDPELWEHVAPEMQAGAWGKVASQAVIFTEDRVRKWAGRPVGEVGKDLAVAIFGKAGQFQMGKTEGETQGWQLFAQGIAQALRNVDAHRIQDRPDHKRYALGLVGACSLLLTQMRYEHGNRFRDTAPASSGSE
ncbi:TIGR02391 family protein [Amycolatopsis orientalis]|uniref:TIGR02391 family protein n=1 Tax=Amycolatopsis orientalis TaxID=31958 RepID=UPI001268C194|nr:TIGR02391 family protein [Amycolatopsis orientalis]